MSKTKEMLMEMYDRYESLEGECDKVEQHWLEIEEQYYNQFIR